WKLTIAGRPGDLSVNDIRGLAEAAGLRNAISIIASPTDTMLKAVMRESSFIASSSEYEGFGLTAVEGLSAGLLPLLSDIPPFRQLVARTRLGLVVDYSLPELGARRLLEKLTTVASHYEEQRATCMQAAKVFDWQHVLQDYAKLYDAVTETTIRTLLDVPIQVRTFNEAVELLDARFEDCEPVSVVFANAHTLNVATADPAFRLSLSRALVFNDGLGVDVASRILYGSAFPKNLNGTDFVPNYLRKTKHRYRIFLLGAKPGVVERAARRLS